MDAKRCDVCGEFFDWKRGEITTTIETNLQSLSRVPIKVGICLTPAAGDTPCDLCQKHRNEAAVAALQAIAANHALVLMSRQHLQDLADGIREEEKKEREATKQSQAPQAAQAQGAAPAASRPA